MTTAMRPQSAYRLTFFLWRKYFRSLLFVSVGFACVTYLLELEREFGRDVGDGFIQQPAVLALLQVPEALFSLLPIVVLLASLNTSLRLARSNELTIIQSIGIAGRSAILRMAVLAAIFGVLSVAILHPLVLWSTQVYVDVTASRLQQDTRVLVESDGYLWIREELNGQITFLRLEQDPESKEFMSAVFVTMDDAGTPARYLISDNVTRLPDGWRLDDARMWQLGSEILNVESTATDIDRIEFRSAISAHETVQRLAAEERIHIWELRQQVEFMEQANLRQTNLFVHVQSLISLPVVFATMTIMGGTGALRPARMLRIPSTVIVAILAGLAVFFMRNLAYVLGINEAVPLISASWTVPVATLLLAFAAILYVE